MKKTTKSGPVDVLLAVFSVAYLVGVRTVFLPCGPKEDGSWMNCHWAGQAVTGVAVCLVILSIAHLRKQRDGGLHGLCERGPHPRLGSL